MSDSNNGNHIGLNLNELKLVSHNPQWASMYADEAEQLRHISNVRDVMHIGSTALQTVDTKPIVDIAALVDGSPDDKSVHDALVMQEYTCHGEYGLPGRQFFTKGNPKIFHLHVVDATSSYWNDWKDFRDYLLTHPEWCKRYQQEKYRIAEKVGWERDRYTAAKSEFIHLVLRKARNQ